VKTFFEKNDQEMLVVQWNFRPSSWFIIIFLSHQYHMWPGQGLVEKGKAMVITTS
jgi:hypothetical protein